LLLPGDLLESEQNASVALRKELADLERQVQALQGNNNTLEKQVGLYCFCCGTKKDYVHHNQFETELHHSDWVARCGTCWVQLTPTLNLGKHPSDLAVHQGWEQSCMHGAGKRLLLLRA
jgi:hypothetical protein